MASEIPTSYLFCLVFFIIIVNCPFSHFRHYHYPRESRGRPGGDRSMEHTWPFSGAGTTAYLRVHVCITCVYVRLMCTFGQWDWADARDE